MNGENVLSKDYFLNDVNITSDIREKGEFKYFYIGENSSESDKSFLYFSAIWYTEKITSDMEIICSKYNHINTAQLYYNKKTKKYNLLVYKNNVDYRNENISLKLHKIINIIPFKRNYSQNNNSKNQAEKDYQNIMNTKIFLASKDYILLNEPDTRILLININTGKFITIFRKSYEENELFYNIFDTYDENILINGEHNIRTYAFISLKKKDRKNPTYTYSYFIIQNTIEKNMHLHPINLDLGNSEPIGLKIAKIYHKDENSIQKCFFIFCFLSTTVSLQFITNYDNLTLHQMFQKYCKIGKDPEKVGNISGKRQKFWINKNLIKVEKVQASQSMNINLNINSKKICALIYFFEMKGIISYQFNYTDSPKVISEKIFLAQKELNLNNGFELIKRNDQNAKFFLFQDCYQFKNKCSFGYSDKNFLIFENNRINIYEQNSENPIFTYEFYDETLSGLILFENIGYTYILSENKLFKIIYNDRYKFFDNEILFSKNKIHYYKYNFSKKGNLQENLAYPLFEYKPEDIWNAYCNNLNIEQMVFPEDETNKDVNEENEEDEEEELVMKIMNKNNYNYELEKYENVCTLCNVESKMVCSHCGARYYCCYEHFRYDYFNFHFFECQLIQFFKRIDIMSIKNQEIRYKILYNELIKVAGRILNFIFTRIFTKNDYPYFLNMILILINIFTNFGFLINLSDFYIMNMNTSNDKMKYRHEKCIFYLESMFYFVQLNLLKCTFTLRGGLYNLTDCYLKMIKSDIIPKLTPKINNRFISLKIAKIKKDIIYNNKYFKEFESPLFFDLKRYIQFLGTSQFIDIAEEYIIYHLKSLSLLAKFKIKIHSAIEVHNILVDTILLFDDHYSENFNFKNIVPYSYFSTSFYLVEVGKISQTVKLLRRMVGENYEVHLKNRLYALTYYNLGLLQYAIGYFDIGIHNIEIAYKIMMINNFSEKLKFKIMDSLGLAYLNQKNLFKAYILFQTSIKARKQTSNDKFLLKCNKLYVYLNYIIDLYEYNYISKTRSLIEKKHKNENQLKLIKFILGEEDKELVISEQDLAQFVKVVEFIWKLEDRHLKQLNTDNPPKAPSVIKEEIHREKSFTGNSEYSQISSFMYKDNLGEKNILDEYEEDIEVKVNLYESFTRQQKQEFKELKTIYLKRDIILRDSLGIIEKFNINYEPIFAAEFLEIIEKLKVNFLLKDIFYCFQNEKWRDELYNYNQNNILFGLSKYLKLEKIQNMLAIEKSKNLERKRKEKDEIISSNELNHFSLDEEEKNIKDNNLNDENLNSPSKEKSEEEELSKDKEKEDNNNKMNEYNFNRELENMPENNKDFLNKKKENMSFHKFKQKFKKALKQQEKDNKIRDLLDFIMDPNENYLYNLYENVYKNNPDKNFIFQNPSLVLNYIFIDINKPDSSPIILKNNQIIKSVISNVKEEDEESSLISKKNKNKDSLDDISISEKKDEEINDQNIKEENKKDKNNLIHNEIDERLRSKGHFKKKEKQKKSKKQKEEFEQRNIIISNNIYEESTLLSFEKEIPKQPDGFEIISKESEYLYIPKKKPKKRTKGKKGKKGNKYRFSLPPNYGINLLKNLESKKLNNSSFVKDKQNEKTFIEEIDRRYNFSLINHIEDDDIKKSFALIQMKNRNFNLSSFGKKSMDTSNILSNQLENKNKTKKDNFLLITERTKKLWDEKPKEDNKKIYKKIDNKDIKSDKSKMKAIKNDLLIIDEAIKKVNPVKKTNFGKTYLQQAKIKQKHSNIRDKELTYRQRKEKETENETTEQLSSRISYSNNYSRLNKNINNYSKLIQKEEKKENNFDKNLYQMYVGMGYKKIEAKKKKNSESLYDKEKRKILNYNNKFIIPKKNTNKKINNEISYENNYYNMNNSVGLNNKISKFDESSHNNKNFIYENSNSYIRNLNSISNTSKIYKNNVNKSIEILSERNSIQNLDDNSSRLIKKYKLYPFVKKEHLFRSVENSKLNSLSNTNTHTPKNKKKKIEQNVRGLIKNTKLNKFVISYRNGK